METKVTRMAYSQNLNRGKYAQLAEIAKRLGKIRKEVWHRYGSVSGVRFMGLDLASCSRLNPTFSKSNINAGTNF